MSDEDKKFITASRAVVRGWGGFREDSFRVTHLKGALSNRLLSVSLPDAPEDVPQKVVVRIFGTGTSGLIDRAIEKHIARILPTKHAGLGPIVISEFADGTGRIERFVPGHPLNWRDMTDSSVASELARLMAIFHSQKINIEEAKSSTTSLQNGAAILFPHLKSWLAQAKAASQSVENREKQAVISKLGLDSLDKEIAWLQGHLSSFNSPVVFCHNDFQALNVLCDDSEDDERRYTVLDFEYAGYNYRGYDIANTLCECYIDNHYPQFPHFNISVQNFPTQQQIRHFLRCYLTEYKNVQEGVDLEQEVLQLDREVRSFMLASHLLWGLWGVVQVASSQIEGFGFAEYAQQRLAEYARLKQTIQRVSGLVFSPAQVPAASESDLAGVLLPKKVPVHGFSLEEDESPMPLPEPAPTPSRNRLGLSVSTERRPSVAEEVPTVFSVAEKVPVHGFVDNDAQRPPVKAARRKVVQQDGLQVSLSDLPDEDDGILSVRRRVHGLEEELDAAIASNAAGASEVAVMPLSPESKSLSKLQLAVEQSAGQQESDGLVIPAKKVPFHGFLHPARTLAPLQLGPGAVPDGAALPDVLAMRVAVHGFGEGEGTPNVSEPGSGRPEMGVSSPGGRLSVSTDPDAVIPEEYPEVFQDIRSPVHGFQLNAQAGEEESDNTKSPRLSSISVVEDEEDVGEGLGDLASPKEAAPAAEEPKESKKKLTKGKSKRKAKGKGK